MRKAADFVEPVAAHDERRSDAERAAPAVLRWLKDVEEETLVVDDALFGQKIMLDRISIVIELWCLHDRDIRLRQQKPDSALEEVAARCEVSVQHQDDWRVGLARSQRKPIVEIAGLSML